MCRITHILTILFLCYFAISASRLSCQQLDQKIDFDSLTEDVVDDAEEDVQHRSWFEKLSFAGLMMCSVEILWRTFWNLHQQRKGVYELTPERYNQLIAVLDLQQQLIKSMGVLTDHLSKLKQRVVSLEQMFTRMHARKRAASR